MSKIHCTEVTSELITINPYSDIRGFYEFLLCMFNIYLLKNYFNILLYFNGSLRILTPAKLISRYSLTIISSYSQF